MKLKNNNQLVYFLIILLFGVQTTYYSQANVKKELEGYTNPEELVSISEKVSFDTAVDILSNVSEKMSGKKVVSTVEKDEPIGINIRKTPYWKALNILVQYHDLTYEERQEVFVISKPRNANKDLSEDIYAPVSEREVKISAIFFEANVSEMKERGVNWKWLFEQNGFSIGSELISTSVERENEGQDQQNQQQQQDQTTADYSISTEGEFSVGDFNGKASSIFRFLEDENLGEIISRPNVTVRDGREGRIQIGSDISIKQRDFAGNVIEQFISTGTIIEVTPYIYEEDSLTYSLLKLNVERSSAQPGQLTTEISKTQANTEVLMLDGEETVIGGLFVNQEKSARVGIPFLKDLPWWVLGIRYLTGYEQEQVIKKEVIIMIKVEIVPSLKERISRKYRNPIEQQRMENRREIEKFKSDTINNK
jgi:type IV pilus assembly protein PilQ